MSFGRPSRRGLPELRQMRRQGLGDPANISRRRPIEFAVLENGLFSRCTNLACWIMLVTFRKMR
jgi:hypothetical protein